MRLSIWKPESWDEEVLSLLIQDVLKPSARSQLYFRCETINIQRAIVLLGNCESPQGPSFPKFASWAGGV